MLTFPGKITLNIGRCKIIYKNLIIPNIYSVPPDNIKLKKKHVTRTILSVSSPKIKVDLIYLLDSEFGICFLIESDRSQ